MQKKTRRMLAIAASGTVVGLFAAVAGAQQVGYNGGTYTQNFDSLPNSGFAGSTFPSATGIFDLTSNTAGFTGAGMTGWYVTNIQTNAPNPLKLYTSDGSNTQASLGVFGSFGSTGSPERAMGGTANTGGQARYGVKLVNTSATTYSSFTINYDLEQWATASNPIDILNRVDYGVGATDLNSGSFTSVAPTRDAETTLGGGTMNPIVQGGTNSTLDGNADANRLAKSFTVNGIAWLPGQTMFIRFNDNNDANVDATLAIDNFTFTAGGATSSLAWNAKGPAGGTWDTNANNKVWLDGANQVERKIQVLSPDIFVMSGTWEMTSSTTPANNATVRCTDVFQRDVSGNWPIVTEHCSPAPKPA